ncbi:hypothetical protein V496_07902 [Pseudogymnoascus sp. VKM F-4515 (FW-2607)]|nr:hypothetical protein V496_07902 [Pseudogymnoascus sp. VKM F-4515 (FW-2607)]KFY80356.1 hypothetical protein V498_08811 [Pseudogymnoascus sp. VKM F-4517 (FW-2822)]
MWLLNVKTKKLKEFVGKETPGYAILSHTWGENEATFKDIKRNGYTSGSTKIDGSCAQAQAFGLEYIWIDTCCIDKRSSSELLEAISSMWDWYNKATICFAYLSDVPEGDDCMEEDSPFSNSRWFKRGWTLQELIAPPVVRFYNASWGFIGRKSEHQDDHPFTAKITKITGISWDVLKYVSVAMHCSVAEKMSWAAGRETTRPEDVAYSLLGIFGLNGSMTAMYGEGSRAFRRLQEEIINTSNDESVFSWGFSQGLKNFELCSLFASSPADFGIRRTRERLRVGEFKPSHFSLTNMGLYIEMRICSLDVVGGSLALLNCSPFVGVSTDPPKSIALPLISSKRYRNCFSRVAGCPPVLVPSNLFSKSDESHIYIDTGRGEWASSYLCNFELKYRILGEDANPMITEFYPPGWSGLLDHGGMISCEKISLIVPRQTIIFLCKRDKQPNFAVWVDGDFEAVDYFALQPRNIQYRAALVPEGKTLAELILESGGGLASTLDWSERLRFGGEELTLSTDILDSSHNYKQMSRWRLTVEVEELRQLDTQTMIRNVPEVPTKEQFPMPRRSEIEAWMTELTNSPKKKARRLTPRLFTVVLRLWGILSWF